MNPLFNEQLSPPLPEPATGFEVAGIPFRIDNRVPPGVIAVEDEDGQLVPLIVNIGPFPEPAADEPQP